MAERARKFLGIIGGMGAEAGAELYRHLVRLTPADIDQQHIETLIYSNTNIPDRTQGILKKGPDSFPLLLESARLLEKNGVDIIIMACVTSHYYIEDLRQNLRCEVLSAIEETIEKIREDVPRAVKIGILTTTGAIKTELFQKALKEIGRQPLILPDDLQEEYFMKAIYAPDGIKAKFVKPARDRILRALNWLIENGAEAIISGCSELPLLFNQSDCRVPLIDAMDVLVRKTILKCTGKPARDDATNRHLFSDG